MNQAFFRLLWQLAVYAFAAVIVSAVIHSDMLRRLTVNTPEKVGIPLAGPRTDPGDNYVYFTYAKNGLSSCGLNNRSRDGDLAGNPIACTYLGALVVSHGLYRIAAVLAPSLRFEPALTLILHTALLAFALLICLANILDRQFRLGTSIALSGAILFILVNFGLSFYLGRPYFYFGNVYALEPDIIRIMNPTVFWALGLFLLGMILYAIKKPSGVALLGCAFLSLLLGTASIAVAGTLLAGLGLYICLEWLVRKRLCKTALLSAGLLLVGLMGVLWMFKVYWASDIGGMLKHGQFLGLKANKSYLWLLLPIVIGRISPAGGASDRLLKATLFAAMTVGMFCTSVELGDRLWSRGALIFALTCCAAWLWCLMEKAISFLPGREWHAGKYPKQIFNAVLCIAAPLCLFGVLLHYRPWHENAWRGFVEHDKYEVVAWLDKHAGRGDIVASSDIDDSYVIPFYTRAGVLIPVFGLTSASLEEGVRRYFHVISLLANGDDILSRTLNTKDEEIQAHLSFITGDIVKAPYNYQEFQKVVFYESLIYYPYNNSFKGILESGKKHQEFVTFMHRLQKEGGERQYGFTYLVLRTDEHLKYPEKFNVVFRNASYIVLQPGARRSITGSHSAS